MGTLAPLEFGKRWILANHPDFRTIRSFLVMVKLQHMFQEWFAKHYRRWIASVWQTAPEQSLAF